MKSKESKFKIIIMSSLLSAAYWGFVKLNATRSDWETVYWNYASEGNYF